jgi:hypothetical protein
MNKIPKDFVSSLNKQFNENYSDRFLAILIGPWFHFALNNFYNRFNSIKGNLYNYKIQEIVVCSEFKNETFSADNTLNFIINLKHPIEKVGEKLRAMMPWIGKNKLVDKSKN